MQLDIQNADEINNCCNMLAKELLILSIPYQFKLFILLIRIVELIRTLVPRNKIPLAKLLSHRFDPIVKVGLGKIKFTSSKHRKI